MLRQMATTENNNMDRVPNQQNHSDNQNSTMASLLETAKDVYLETSHRSFKEIFPLYRDLTAIYVSAMETADPNQIKNPPAVVTNITRLQNEILAVTKEEFPHKASSASLFKFRENMAGLADVLVMELNKFMDRLEAAPAQGQKRSQRIKTPEKPNIPDKPKVQEKPKSSTSQMETEIKSWRQQNDDQV